MINFFEYIFLILLAGYSIIRSLSYALYEIREQKNRVGGIFVILLSLLAFVLLNISLLI